MFETALLTQRRQSRRTSVFVAAIGAHAVLLGGVVAAQYWKVDAVVEPQMVEVFRVSLPAPPPPKAEVQKKAQTPPQKHDVVPPTPTPPAAPPTAVQPDHVPDAVPPTPATAAADDGPASGPPSNGNDSGSSTGVDYSIGSGDGDAPIEIGQGITPPVALSRVAPLYTEGARRARIQGVVIVEAVIDRLGNVGEVRMVKGLGFGLDENAANAVARWKFKPAHAADGRTVSVYFRLTVDYHLN